MSAPVTSVDFGLPCYGGLISAHTMRALVDTTHVLAQRKIGWQLDVMFNESLITRARNNLVARFLASNHSHLMFIDADIAFHPTHVLALIDSGHDVVCGAYPKKAIAWERVRQAALAGEQNLERVAAEYAINFLPPPSDAPRQADGSAEVQLQTQNGCIPILDAATGFLLMSRDAILRVIEAYPDLMVVSDDPQSRGKLYWAIFDTMLEPETRRYLSEDYAFSRRWQKVGGTVWLHVGVQLGHFGNTLFAGDIGTVVRTKPSPLPEDARPSIKLPPMLDHVATADLIGVLNGSYDVPVDNPEIVLDIGANVGCFAAWAHQRWPNAKVIAYEPHPKNVELLRENAPFAEIHAAAVRELGVPSLLREGGPNLGCSSFTDLGLQSDRVISVDCEAASSLPAADVVKIDTEGEEVPILEHLDLSRARAVMFEWHSIGDHRTLTRIMEGKGFTLLHEQSGDRGTGTQKWIREDAKEQAA